MKAIGGWVLFGAAALAPLLLAHLLGHWAAPAGALGVVALWGRHVPISCTEPDGSLLHSAAGMMLLVNVPLTLILAVVT